MQIDVLHPSELPASAMAAWRAMQRAGGGWDLPFLSPCWARSVELAQSARKGGGRDVRVAILSEAGEPRAFMPAQVGRITALAAGGAMSDYEGLVGDPGPGFDVTRLVRALGVSRYDFSHVPAEQDAFARFARGGSVSWVVDAPDGYAAYAERRRADGVSALKEIDRKRRKAEREVGPTVFTARSTCRDDFERLVALKRSQYRATGQTDVLSAGWTLKLLDDLFALDLPGFGGALFTLHIGEALAAAQFHLMGETTIHTWMVAHEAAFERYSPGLLLFQDILKLDGRRAVRPHGPRLWRLPLQARALQLAAAADARLRGRAVGRQPAPRGGVRGAARGRGAAARRGLGAARQGDAPHRPDPRIAVRRRGH